MTKFKYYVISFFSLVLSTPAFSQQPQTWNPGEIQLALEKLNTLGSVLYIAAHPDDENTRLLSYLANERKYRTVYLSLTRGDGGQNLIGKEQGEELGMIRTQELLAARSIDGAEQVFARCNDFGYSKSAAETFNIWNKDEVLADVVWAIRMYRPDVIINRFPATGEGGHGHHTASAILALEAFKAAGDPTKFPEQLVYVQPWKAKRIFHNSFNFRNQPASNFEGQIKLDVGGYSPLLGKSYGEIASDSRSMHKSQGFGVARSRGTQFEHFKRLDGDTTVNEIFENINTGWSRIPGSSKIEELISKTISEFDAANPHKIVSNLIVLLKMIDNNGDAYWKEVKRKEVMNLIVACSGIWFEVNAKDYFSAPGDSVVMTVSAISRLLDGVSFSDIRFSTFDTTLNKNLSRNEIFSFQKGIVIPLNSEFTNPYWLNQPYTQSSYVVNDIQMTGKPWNDQVINDTFRFNIEGQTLTYTIPVNHKWTDPVKGEIYRPFEIVPAVSLTPSDDVMIFAGKNSKPLKIKIKLQTDSLSGILSFGVPNGWTVSPSEIPLTLSGKGREFTQEVLITPPSPSDKITDTADLLKIIFQTGNTKHHRSVRRIEYDHIPYLISLRSSDVKLIVVDLTTQVKKIGYIEGAGDEVARCLKQAGFEVDILDEYKILNTPLSGYGAIITGIRAYNTIENIDSWYLPLMKYVEDGGNLIVQYNTSNFISSVKSMLGPYPFKITRERVTEEDAEVNFDSPGHGLLNKPNKITKADFNNWVQERGLYFANELSQEYETVLSWNDQGEKPLNGGLIIAKKGSGNFIYTGISFFRQLPAGVPGAYRLMVNLINAGTE